jgi:hypothetical protein
MDGYRNILVNVEILDLHTSRDITKLCNRSWLCKVDKRQLLDLHCDGYGIVCWIGIRLTGIHLYLAID